MDYTPVVVQFIMMVGGLFVAVYAGRKELSLRKLDRQEEWMNRLERENETLRERLDDLERDVRMWAEGALILYRQLLRSDIVPAWRPPENGREPEDPK